MKAKIFYLTMVLALVALVVATLLSGGLRTAQASPIVRNVALEGTALTIQGEDAFKAIDGDKDTYVCYAGCECRWNVGGRSVIVDLGKEYDCERIYIKWTVCNVLFRHVLISTDGIEWKDVISVPQSTSIYENEVTFTPPKKCRYIKAWTGAGWENSLLIYEIEAYAEAVATGSISGAVYEQDGTTPVSSSSTISAYDWNTDALVASTATSTGTYIITGLPAGDYKVGASGSGYVDEYYQEETSSDKADRVRVTAGQDTPNMDFTLSRVYDATPGNPVVSAPYSGVTIEFTDLTEAVSTSVDVSEKNPGGSITGFKFLGKYYDIVTTPTYTGSVTLTISYNQADVKGKERNLKLFHLVSGVWVRVTDPPPIIDENNNTITATVASLSWFAIAEESAGDGGCFIATAAYGTSTAAELDTLRAFRDEVLLQNSLGSQLVALYYEVSPPVADFISEHEGLRTLVREFLVEPVVWVVEATESFWRD